MADQASKKELKQLKAVFKDMDKDKDKKVTILELKTAMEKKARIDHNMDVQLNVMYDEEKWVLRLQTRLVNFPLN